MKKYLIINMLLLSFNLFSLMPISQSDKDGIIWLSESTKLSKDVYHEIYRIWDVGIFRSIEILEENDMVAIDKILNHYKLINPNLNSTLGTYQSPYISKLFTDFSVKYDNSELEALRIAATLEDLMISDLNELLELSTNSDFTEIYKTLRLNAISEIRAVNTYMKNKYKVEYQAQFLSRQDLKAILLN